MPECVTGSVSHRVLARPSVRGLFQGRLLLYQWIETVPNVYELVHQLAVVILGRLGFEALLHIGL